MRENDKLEMSYALFEKLLKDTLVSCMLLFIDPIVYIVHAYDATRSALHERNARLEPAVALRQKTALFKDGECLSKH